MGTKPIVIVELKEFSSEIEELYTTLVEYLSADYYTIVLQPGMANIVCSDMGLMHKFYADLTEMTYDEIVKIINKELEEYDNKL